MLAKDEGVKKVVDILGEYLSQLERLVGGLSQPNQQCPQFGHQVAVNGGTIKAGFEQILEHSPVFAPAQVVVVDQTWTEQSKVSVQLPSRSWHTHS